jgi:nucleoside-diphosphate-sugar epimerase
MQLFVTGTSGRVGSAIVTDLLAHGHTVVATDQVPPRTPVETSAGAYRFVQMELDNVEELKAEMAGCEGLIHMAAIPHPRQHPDEFVFNNNMTSCFNTYQAASLLDIRKVVAASSLSALGTVWAEPPFLPLYVPIDEEHPLLPHDCYSLSKALAEDIGHMFHRRTGMQVVMMRFPWVIQPFEYPDMVKRVAEDLAAYAPHLWTYVDVRDAATACRQAIERDGLGFDVLDITAADTIADRPTMDLIAEFAPSVEIRARLEGYDAVFTCERAVKAIGYQPRWSWRQAV